MTKQKLLHGGFMQKRSFLLITLTILTITLAYSQETHRISLGIGIEGNLNSRQDMALGENLTFDYEINRFLALGIKLGANQNFKRLQIWEPEAFIRWYFMDLSGPKLFIQGDLGASIIYYRSDLYPVIMGGISGGIRFPLNNWYVEPYIRGGYPFILGAGICAGYRF
jgi:hypothetical protein